MDCRTANRVTADGNLYQASIATHNNMNFDKYSAYCKEHLDEFRDELRDDASLRSAGNPMASKALLAYAFPILLIFAYPWASLIFSRLDKYARTVLDVFLLGILFGFCQSLSYVFAPAMTTTEQSDAFLALSGQINFVILMTTAFSYHASFAVTLGRNTVFTALAAVLVYLINAQYLSINTMQFVQGYLGGIIVSWIFFRRIQTRFYYKSIDADTRQHLYKQLSKLVYPHQLARIKAGDQEQGHH